MEFHNYTDGKWGVGQGERTFKTIDPANEEILAQIHTAEITDGG
jgi:acyl-CoA reductase-like NAD-dependent aldehyde dehydrogenase